MRADPRRVYEADDPLAAHALGQLFTDGSMSFNWRLLMAPERSSLRRLRTRSVASR